MHARRVPEETRAEAGSCPGCRRTNRQAVAESLAAAIREVAQREDILGVLLRIEIEPRVGTRSVVVLEDDRAVRVRENEQGVERRAEATGGDIYRQLLV